MSVAERLPPGAGIVFRHFGQDDAPTIGSALAEVARRRGLVLLIGDDEGLAARLGAHGVHLPERNRFRAVRLRARHPGWLITVAAHHPRALSDASRVRADAAVLSAVFPSRSASAGRALGAARSAALIREAKLPVYALGGVNTATVRRLRGTGAAGLASIDGLIDA